FHISDDGNEKVKILTKGLGAHASTPEKGKNAITALFLLLSSMPFAQCQGLDVIKALSKIFPHADYYGEAAGIKMSDEISGELTLSFNIFEYTQTKFKGYADCRIPICATKENTMKVLYSKFREAGIRVTCSEFNKAHHTPEDLPFVQTLLSAYEKYTGRKGYCMHVGGGTYVHGIDGGVSFGCAMPGVDANVHGADEFVVIDDIITAAKIFAQAIIDLCS
ncbi:MAG TPA: peptidase M20, partial [Ruminiclostridium sp.]|nr:peptidase M20 [Ruminiclostridium sp.]